MPYPSKNRRKDALKTDASEDTGKIEEIDPGFAGQRKLIRPVMPENAAAQRGAQRESQRRGFRGILTRREMAHAPAAPQDISHAEAFYLQKQIYTQTQMVIILENGEQIEGCIEWYDQNCIKVRNSGRVLIYKSAIKYLYKAAERDSERPMTLV